MEKTSFNFDVFKFLWSANRALRTFIHCDNTIDFHFSPTNSTWLQHWIDSDWIPLMTPCHVMEMHRKWHCFNSTVDCDDNFIWTIFHLIFNHPDRNNAVEGKQLILSATHNHYKEEKKNNLKPFAAFSTSEDTKKNETLLCAQRVTHYIIQWRQKDAKQEKRLNETKYPQKTHKTHLGRGMLLTIHFFI